MSLLRIKSVQLETAATLAGHPIPGIGDICIDRAEFYIVNSLKMVRMSDAIEPS